MEPAEISRRLVSIDFDLSEMAGNWALSLGAMPHPIEIDEFVTAVQHRVLAALTGQG
jgi:hypothetical protein